MAWHKDDNDECNDYGDVTDDGSGDGEGHRKLFDHDLQQSPFPSSLSSFNSIKIDTSGSGMAESNTNFHYWK